MNESVSNKKRRTIAAIYVITFMAAFALSSGLFSNAMPRIIEGYKLTFDQASLFSIFQSAGMILATALTVLVVDRLDKNKALGLMFLLMGGFLVCIGMAPPFVLLLVALFLLGTVSGVLDNACAAYISDLFGDERAKYISILHAFFGLGSVLGPVFIGTLFKMGFEWNTAYTTFGLVVVFLALAYFVTMAVIKRPEPAVSGVDEAGVRVKIPYKKIVTSPQMLVLCGMAIFSAATQVFNTWLPTYLNNKDALLYPVSFCSTIMACYSVGMIISRVLNGAILRALSPRKYIITMTFLGALVLGAGLAIDQKLLWPVVSFLLGLLVGAIYTVQIIMACSYFPQFSATVISYAGLASSVGGMLFNALAGQLAQRVSFLSAMCIPVAGMVGTFLLMGLTRRVGSHTEAVEE